MPIAKSNSYHIFSCSFSNTFKSFLNTIELHLQSSHSLHFDGQVVVLVKISEVFGHKDEFDLSQLAFSSQFLQLTYKHDNTLKCIWNKGIMLFYSHFGLFLLWCLLDKSRIQITLKRLNWMFCKYLYTNRGEWRTCSSVDFFILSLIFCLFVFFLLIFEIGTYIVQ